MGLIEDMSVEHEASSGSRQCGVVLGEEYELVFSPF